MLHTSMPIFWLLWLQPTGEAESNRDDLSWRTHPDWLSGVIANFV
jgi:hypothetical protein